VCDLCGSGRAVTLGPEIVHAVGFDPEEALLPWPRLAPDGYRLVQEYFTLPQKFLFLDLRPMSAARGAEAERFEIRLLFSATAEPILSEVAGALAGVPLEVGRVARGKETDAIAEHGRPDVAVVYLPASHAVALREALPVPLDALVIEERGGGAPPA